MLAILAAAALASPFMRFEGQWHCNGRFVVSGKSIVSDLSIRLDPASGVAVVHHDDAAPMSYHSVELWVAATDGAWLEASVADRGNGLRIFRSPVLNDGTLAFSRGEGGRQELFRYTLKGPDKLEVEWSVAGTGQALRLGDTLSCERSAAERRPIRPATAPSRQINRFQVPVEGKAAQARAGP